MIRSNDLATKGKLLWTPAQPRGYIYAPSTAAQGLTMDRRTKICIWVIVLGLANFFAYTLIYVFINGEAVNGAVVIQPGGELGYELQSGTEVSRVVFIYSGIHSISIWPTVAAVMLAMLTLAKDRIVSSMRSAVVRGRTFITILATLIAFTTAIITAWFVLQFTSRLTPESPQKPTEVTMLVCPYRP